jgi:hypothetical protein
LTYYLLVGMTTSVAAFFVAVIVMLYNAFPEVIQAVSPDASR